MVLEEMLLAERREGRSEGKAEGNRSVRKRISVISYTRRREVFLVSGS